VDLPPRMDCFPFKQSRGSNFHFSWDSNVTAETNWSVTFPMALRNGKALGTFSLHRKSTPAPLWVDLNVFTTTGFSVALTNVFEKIQDGWLTADSVRDMAEVQA